MIEMELSKIVINEASEEQIIILKEKQGTRIFPIVIGIYEAAALDRQVRNVKTARPLTHDLIISILKGLEISVKRVVINDLQNNTFYARLLVQNNGREVEIDSRPSDAIVLASHLNCPIFVEEKILNNLAKEID
ncbi:MAG: bifunctional nuclease family protein [Candidatus Brocadiia bacterium]